MAESVKFEFSRRYRIKNLCDWDLSIGQDEFNIHVKASKTFQLKGEDLETLIMNGNKFFNGTGGGDHAKLLIMDEDAKKYFEFTNQIVLDDEKIKYVLGLKTDKSFEDNIEKYVVLNHEKDKLYNYLLKNGFDDMSAKRLKFIENHVDRRL